MHTDSAVRRISKGKKLPPMGFKSSTGTSTSTRWDSRNRGSQEINDSNVSDHKRVFSATEKIIPPKIYVCQSRPRNLGGNMINSVVPSNKPGPQWFPMGFTHTPKQRIQRLRALEIREEIAKRKSDEWLNKDMPMVRLKMTWREKRITTEENINADDMVADGISEISRDTLI
jgi:hypothetical protein